MNALIQRIHANDALFGLLCVLLATLGLSLKAIFIKLIYQLDPTIDAASMLALRFLFALPFFAMLLHYPRRKQDAIGLTRKNIMPLVLLGMIGFYLSAILDFSGLAYIPAGLERLILYLYPTIVVMIALVGRPREVNRATIIAVVLSYLGVVFVFIEHAPHMTGSMIKGSALVFAAAVCFAVYTMASVTQIKRHGSIRYTALTLLAATVVSVVHASLVNGMHTFLRSLDVYLLILPMAIFSTVLPLILTAEGVKRIGAANASILSTSGPVLTLCMAFFLLGETFGPLQAIGAALILIGVSLVSRKRAV